MSRIVSMLWLVFAFLLTNDTAMADIKKWVEPGGRVHYGDWPPPEADAAPVKVRPNVIETRQRVPQAVANRRLARPKATPETSTAVAPEPRKDIGAYIEQCRENRGVDCEREARAMIDGPAPLFFPGDPAVFPRPDVEPPPPGLTLKYGITP
jgi:hypothetical protein